jgi:hypothetical protein
VSSRSALTCYCRAPSRRLTFADLRWWQEGCSLPFCELWRGRGSPRARSPVLPFPLSAMHPRAVSQQGWCLPSCELRGGWVSPPSLLCYCYSALLCIASRALRLVLPLLLSLCSSPFCRRREGGWVFDLTETERADRQGSFGLFDPCYRYPLFPPYPRFLRGT